MTIPQKSSRAKPAPYRVLLALGGFGGNPLALDSWNRIVAVDAGGEHLFNFGILANDLVGDFDSISPAAFEFHKAGGAATTRFSADKDFTDLEGALRRLDSPPHAEIHIIGMMGGRLDHLLCNLTVLRHFTHRGLFTFDTSDGFGGAFGPGKLSLRIPKGVETALIPLSPIVKGVSSSGVKWPLEKESLRFGTGRGISNQAVSNRWKLSVEEGALLWLVTGVSREAAGIGWNPGPSRNRVSPGSPSGRGGVRAGSRR